MILKEKKTQVQQQQLEDRCILTDQIQIFNPIIPAIIYDLIYYAPNLIMPGPTPRSLAYGKLRPTVSSYANLFNLLVPLEMDSNSNKTLYSKY